MNQFHTDEQPMKLASALSERSDIQNRLNMLSGRLANNAKVQNVKTIPGFKNYTAIDGGMTDNPRYALYGSRYTVLLANRTGEEADFLCNVAGRCCESGDLIGENLLCQRPKVGDTLAVLVTGAYNYAMSSNYNAIPRPPIVMIAGGRDTLAVRRETYEDLVACHL